MIKEITTVEEFNNEISSGQKLVDFYAPWCAPCMRMAPILEDVSENVNYDILKVNIDICPEVAGTYGVRSIPTLIFFNEGNVSKTSIGLKSKNDILAEF